LGHRRRCFACDRQRIRGGGRRVEVGGSRKGGDKLLPKKEKIFKGTSELPPEGKRERKCVQTVSWIRGGRLKGN